jgi:hypothetical protein
MENLVLEGTPIHTLVTPAGLGGLTSLGVFRKNCGEVRS